MLADDRVMPHFRRIPIRTRKDDAKAYTAQIVIKQGGTIVHREAETFDRKQAANARVVKREAELKSPGGLDRKENPAAAARGRRWRLSEIRRRASC